MQLHSRDLRGLPVETGLGQRIGRVSGFVIENEMHGIVSYVVAPTIWSRLFATGELLIKPSQVISITKQKMVVDDTVSAVPVVEGAAMPAQS